MPRREGLETLLEVKRRFPHIVVIAMSAGGVCSSFDFLGMAARLGADQTLSKPFSQQDLTAVLAELPQP